MYLKKGLPSPGELVICRVKKVMAHSATLELTEYENVKAYVHVSQIAQGWVKSVSNHLKKDEEIVCRVIRVSGEEVEVSMKQVSKEAANTKISEARAEKKAESMLKALAKKIGREKFLEKEVIKPVMEGYGSLNAFIELVKQEGDKILEELKIPMLWKKPILDYSSRKAKKVVLKQEISLYTTQENGVGKLKQLLKTINKKGFEIKYISAPKYLIQVTSTNYKDTKKKLDKELETLEKQALKAGFTFSQK